MTSNFAIVFPGQGSQALGMIQELYHHYSFIPPLFEEASELLGYNLWRLIQEGPDTELNLTQKTQPALLVAGYAVWRVWQQEIGLKPQYVAGHSLGEYVALLAAEAIQFAKAVTLVALRGELMQKAAPEGVGAMAAIVGLSDREVEAICVAASLADNKVAPANYNSIGQVVIAGHREAILRAIAKAEAKEAKLAKIIPVSVPSHCFLMAPAAEQFASIIEQSNFHLPNIPVIQNTDGRVHLELSAIKHALARQLVSPVRWVDTIQYMQSQHIDTVLELGPGKVLTGLAKRIDKNLKLAAISDLNSLAKAKELITPVYT